MLRRISSTMLACPLFIVVVVAAVAALMGAKVQRSLRLVSSLPIFLSSVKAFHLACTLKVFRRDK